MVAMVSGESFIAGTNALGIGNGRPSCCLEHGRPMSL